MRLSLFAVMLCAGLAQAQTVTMPKELTGLAGDLLPFSLSHDGDDVAWYSSDGITVFREYSNDPKDIRLRVHGRKPGNFTILAISTKAGKLGYFSVCKVTLQSDVPVPPTPPTPNPPGPNPPGPNPPTPNPGPLPTDPVSLRLIAAWQKDRAGKSDAEVSDRVKRLKALSAFCSQMKEAVKDKTSIVTVDDFRYSWNEAFKLYIAGLPKQLQEATTPELSSQIRNELFAVAGDDALKEIDPDLRDKIVKLLELLILILNLLV